MHFFPKIKKSSMNLYRQHFLATYTLAFEVKFLSWEATCAFTGVFFTSFLHDIFHMRLAVGFKYFGAKICVIPKSLAPAVQYTVWKPEHFLAANIIFSLITTHLPSFRELFLCVLCNEQIFYGEREKRTQSPLTNSQIFQFRIYVISIILKRIVFYEIFTELNFTRADIEQQQTVLFFVGSFHLFKSKFWKGHFFTG